MDSESTYKRPEVARAILQAAAKQPWTNALGLGALALQTDKERPSPYSFLTVHESKLK